MAYVPFPRGVNVRSLRWNPPFDTAQMNRSEFTGGAQIVALPGGGRWGVSGEFVTMIGQDASLEARRFLSALRGPLNTFSVPAWEKRQSSTPLALWSRAPVLNASNCVITGSTAVKVAGGSGFNASAYSSVGWNVGVTLTFRNGNFGALFAAGISLNPLANDTLASVEHGLVIRENGRVDVQILGTTIVNKGWSHPDSLFCIDFDTSNVRYFVDGDLIHTETFASAATMYFDSSISTVGGSIADITLSARIPAAAGSRTAVVYGLPASTANAVPAGWFATALFADGTTQLLTVAYPADSDSTGSAGVTFDAPLRKTAYHIVMDYPFLTARLADAGEWAVDPGQIYSAGFTATEAW